MWIDSQVAIVKMAVGDWYFLSLAFALKRGGA